MTFSQLRVQPPSWTLELVRHPQTITQMPFRLAPERLQPSACPPPGTSHLTGLTGRSGGSAFRFPNATMLRHPRTTTTQDSSNRTPRPASRFHTPHYRGVSHHATIRCVAWTLDSVSSLGAPRSTPLIAAQCSPQRGAPLGTHEPPDGHALPQRFSVACSGHFPRYHSMLTHPRPAKPCLHTCGTRHSHSERRR